MKIGYQLIFVVMMVLSFSGKTLEVDSKLAMFVPYLGTWESEFNIPGGEVSVVDVARWERALNGKAIRIMHSINNGEYGGETLIFWDAKLKQFAFYYFTTADFYTSGRIELLPNGGFYAYEEVSGDNAKTDGITQLRSKSEIVADNMVVATASLKNNVWSAPEQRIYIRSQKKVVFN